MLFCKLVDCMPAFCTLLGCAGAVCVGSERASIEISMPDSRSAGGGRLCIVLRALVTGTWGKTIVGRFGVRRRSDMEWVCLAIVVLGTVVGSMVAEIVDAVVCGRNVARIVA